MRRHELVSEFLGTSVLLIAVVGSSFMASSLTEDYALSLLINASVTASTLAIIIKIGTPISGAHFNPAVSFAKLWTRKINIYSFFSFLISQCAGAILGVVTANFMFHSAIFTTSDIGRSGSGNFVGEIVATTGLVYLALKSEEKSSWTLIPMWIFAAYFFTSSTAFANPAATFARIFTESSAGIQSSSVAIFIAAQFLGANLAVLLSKMGSTHE